MTVTSPARPRSARQAHLGDMLDTLQQCGLLTWRWEIPRGRQAIFWITLPGENEQPFGTGRAEELVQKLCDEQGIVWRPAVPRWVADAES
jgi:hypothetical protein